MSKSLTIKALLAGLLTLGMMVGFGYIFKKEDAPKDPEVAQGDENVNKDGAVSNGAGVDTTGAIEGTQPENPFTTPPVGFGDGAGAVGVPDFEMPSGLSEGTGTATGAGAVVQPSNPTPVAGAGTPKQPSSPTPVAGAGTPKQPSAPAPVLNKKPAGPKLVKTATIDGVTVGLSNFFIARTKKAVGFVASAEDKAKGSYALHFEVKVLNKSGKPIQFTSFSDTQSLKEFPQLMDEKKKPIRQRSPAKSSSAAAASTGSGTVQKLGVSTPAGTYVAICKKSKKRLLAFFIPGPPFASAADKENYDDMIQRIEYIAQEYSDEVDVKLYSPQPSPGKPGMYRISPLITALKLQNSLPAVHLWKDGKPVTMISGAGKPGGLMPLVGPLLERLDEVAVENTGTPVANGAVSQADMLYFDPPTKGMKVLHLDLPASAVGKSGFFELIIPVDSIPLAKTSQ